MNMDAWGKTGQIFYEEVFFDRMNSLRSRGIYEIYRMVLELGDLF